MRLKGVTSRPTLPGYEPVVGLVFITILFWRNNRVYNIITFDQVSFSLTIPNTAYAMQNTTKTETNRSKTRQYATNLFATPAISVPPP